ncbi:MAG: hypothetical protein JRN57_04250 [Nitrososphaerota archaeon]|nr:hypothetical protein [Nitrososphaerota archaeon]
MVMAELLEYCLVFAVSVLLVAGSVAVYESFAGFISGVQFGLASASITRLVNEAMANGSSAGVVTIPPSTLSCGGGTMSFTSGSRSQQEAVAATCDFALNMQGGAHTLGFRYAAEQLTVSVS